MEDEETKSLSPDAGIHSDAYERSGSSAGSACSNTTSIQISIDLHRQNSELLREKEDMEMKHNEEIVALRHQLSRLRSSLATSSANEKRLSEQVQSLLEEKAKWERQLEDSRKDSLIQKDLLEELSSAKEQIRLLKEENEKEKSQLRELKRITADLRGELSEKIGELLELHKLVASQESKDKEIEKLNSLLSACDQQISMLRKEREADNARMLAVKDVQLAHEELRKASQDKDRHIQDLEAVMDQTIHEKAHQSALVIKLQEDLRTVTQEFNDYKLDAERRFEDTCRQYVAQLNALHVTSFGAENYPGKTDNVPTGDKSFAGANNGSHCDTSRSVQARSLTENRSHQYSWNLLANDAALTIETIREEYDIEVQRNKHLQEQLTQVTGERDRLKADLYGEIQNGPLSSLNSVLNHGGSGTDGELQVKFVRLKQELRRCISERDVAKAELFQLRERFEQALQQPDPGDLVRSYEAKMDALRGEKKQFQYNFVTAMNKCKALTYQKDYLQWELNQLRRSANSPAHTLPNGLEETKSISAPRSPAPLRRFKALSYVIIAVVRMKRSSERKRKLRSEWTK